LPFAEVGIEVGADPSPRGEVGADRGLFSPEGGDVDGAAFLNVQQLAPFGLGLGDPMGQQFSLDSFSALALDDPSSSSSQRRSVQDSRSWMDKESTFDSGFEVVDRA
jgi:hypothetical protein